MGAKSQATATFALDGMRVPIYDPPLSILFFESEQSLWPGGGWALVLVLVWTQTGCLWTEESAPSNWLSRLQKQTITPDHALIQVALIERPFRDEFINRTIWDQADEMILDLDRDGPLKQNGFRVGQLVGPTPDDFQKMLLSKRDCSNPQAMIFPAGRTATIYLGPQLRQSTYEFVDGKQRTEITLDQAHYCLEVTAQFDRTGRTKLKFLPKIENGELQLPFQAVPERSTWELRIEKASRKYPEAVFGR